MTSCGPRPSVLFSLTRALLGTAVLSVASALLGPAAAVASRATVSWDRGPEPSLAGYKVYAGTSSGDYQTVLDAGNQIASALDGLEPGRVYYVAVSAYDVYGQESPLSNEVIFTAAAVVDTDGDGLPDALEQAWCTDPNDADTDDDGLPDGFEDADHNGVVGRSETNPCLIDTDRDGLQDGTELRVTLAAIGPDTDTAIFRPDLDPTTGTDPLRADTDRDWVPDGREDRNRNGRLDRGETDPARADKFRLFADDFTDGNAQGDRHWQPFSGRWAVSAGKRYYSIRSRDSRSLIRSAAVRRFRAGRIEARVALSRRAVKSPNAEVLFHYVDARHYRYLRLTRAGLVLGQVGRFRNLPEGVKLTAIRKFAVGKWYGLRLDLERGGILRVYVSGQARPILTYKFPTGATGRIGLQSLKAMSQFDNVAVWSERILL